MKEIETKIKIEYEETLGDTFEEDQVNDNDILGFIKGHIRDYAREHNIPLEAITIVKEK